jgi:hypothetical protein
MKSRSVNSGARRIFVLILDAGEDAFQAITDFADQEKFTGASVTAIGAFAEAKVGWFDPGAKEYKPIIVNGAIWRWRSSGRLNRFDYRGDQRPRRKSDSAGSVFHVLVPSRANARPAFPPVSLTSLPRQRIAVARLVDTRRSGLPSPARRERRPPQSNISKPEPAAKSP